MSNQAERDRLLQTDWHEEIIPSIGDEPWIRVYESSPFNAQEQVSFFCGLVPDKNLQPVLDSCRWDLSIGDSAPSFVYGDDDDSEDTNLIYDRFGHHDHGIQPLVIVRNFQEFRPQSVEVIEEFRLFHNLYFESSPSMFVKFDDSGDEIPVVKMSNDFVEFSRKHLRQFLAAKQMSLVVYFEHKYYSSHTLADLRISETTKDIRLDGGLYEFGVKDCRDLGISDYASRSWVNGKKIIEGLPLQECGLWPFDEEPEKEFEDFLIGIDANDDPIYYTSNPDKLAGYFGKNPDALHFLTPVFFRPEVLAKYYHEQTKYQVEDGTLWCGGDWMLRMDNNHPDYVIVFLGDLGGVLPHQEQLHWKQFNIPPDETISKT